jgi:methyl-accepting chemotaxis protein
MKMTIAKKLYLLIFVVILGLVMFTAVSQQKMHKIHSDASYAAVNVVPSLLSIAEVTAGISSLRIYTWRQLALSDGEDSLSVEKIASAKIRVAKGLEKYERDYAADEKDKQLLFAVRDAYSTFLERQTAVMALVKAGKWSEARALMSSIQPIIDQVNAALEKHRKYNEQLGDVAAKKSLDTIGQATLHASIISTVVILIVAGLGILIARQIVGAIASAVVSAEAIAGGDLTRRIEATSQDEIGDLMLAMSKMNSSLIDIVSNVRSGVSTIAAASSQIAMGNIDLSSRTEAQASSLEETASATEELTSTVKQNAENARQANQLAASASGIAVQGGEVVKQVVATMTEINTSSAKVVDIISVIDSIAFQTNILALNAAVEAARAGEQGRGFAVVATEVRNLAQRSATAAKEIKQLIDDSVSRAELGSKLVEQAGATMEQVVTSVQRVTDVVNEISLASGEQTVGIEQVNQAISQMDQTTQENAALVEESAAAAKALEQQAKQLEEAVSIFKLHAQPVAAPSPAPVRAVGSAAPRATVQARPRLVTASSDRKPVAELADKDSWEEF